MAAKKKKAGRPKGSKNLKKKAKKRAGRPKGSKNVKKKAKKKAGRPKSAKKKAGRPKAAKRRGPVKTRTVTIPASLADKIEGLTLLGKGGAIEKAIDKLIR